MLFTQYYLECLSQASYLIGDDETKRAVVVDPRRDIDEYLADAQAAGMTIELVIETHFHADFLSGHLELAERTGAEIGFGEVAETEFPIRKLHDGERVSLGNVTLEILSTPGHTPESISIVVYEHADDERPYGVLTGDTLFIGDVGRPDLLGSLGVTAGELASELYDSLHDKLMVLPDATRVFPAHGAGSACGKNLSTETQSTIGEQRALNYAVQPMSKATFIDVVTEGQPTAPGYFGYDARLNRTEHEVLDEHGAPESLDWVDFEAHRSKGAIVIDARDPADFARGHLRGTVSVGIAGRFAEYVGSVVRPDEPILLVGEPGTEEELRVRLGRIGFDNIAGYLESPYRELSAHPDQVEVLSRVTAAQLAERLEDDTVQVQVVDVRNPGEVQLGAVPGARPIPLPQLRDRLDELDPELPVVVYCAGGYRSAIGASLLATSGFSDVSDLVGGYAAWAARS